MERDSDGVLLIVTGPHGLRCVPAGSDLPVEGGGDGGQRNRGLDGLDGLNELLW